MTVTDARAQLAAAVEAAAGVPAYANIPDKVVPDCAVMTPADPWLTAGPYDATVARYELFLLVRGGPNAAAVDRVEALTLDVLDAVLATDWGVDEVSAPYMAEVAGLNLLTTRLTITTTTGR